MCHIFFIYSSVDRLTLVLQHKLICYNAFFLHWLLLLFLVWMMKHLSEKWGYLFLLSCPLLHVVQTLCRVSTVQTMKQICKMQIFTVPQSKVVWVLIWWFSSVTEDASQPSVTDFLLLLKHK